MATSSNFNFTNNLLTNFYEVSGLCSSGSDPYYDSLSLDPSPQIVPLKPHLKQSKAKDFCLLVAMLFTLCANLQVQLDMRTIILTGHKTQCSPDNWKKSSPDCLYCIQYSTQSPQTLQELQPICNNVSEVLKGENIIYLLQIISIFVRILIKSHTTYTMYLYNRGFQHITTRGPG